jgi:PAS domain S-box-containing protein
MASNDKSTNIASIPDQDDKMSTFLNNIIVIIAVLFFVIFNVWYVINGRPASLDLHFNYFALLSFSAVISNIVAFILISRNRHRSDVLLWLSVLQLSLAYWAATDTLFRLSASPAAAVFWSPFSTIGAVFVPVSIYMFALKYTGSKYSRSPTVFPILAGVSALLVFIDGRSKLIDIYNASATISSRWGYIIKSGPAYIAFVSWIILLTTASVILLARYRRSVKEPILRSQTKLFIIATLIPLVVGSITDGIAPALDSTVIPPLVVILISITGIIISYGVLKHHFFSFTPELVASQILATINDAVVGTTPALRISYANLGAEAMFGLSANELVNRRLSEFLNESNSSDYLEQKIQDYLIDHDFYSIDSVRLQPSPDKSLIVKLSVTKVVSGNQLDGYLIVLADITALANNQAIIEQKVIDRTYQLHEEQAKLRALIESLKVGFALIDPNGNVLIQNDAMAAIFGLSQAAENLDQLQSKLADVNLKSVCRQASDSGQTTRLDDVNLDTKILQIFVGPVTTKENIDKRVVGTVILVEDITEAKILERSKDEFFSIASHELRTPLTSIKGNSSMVLEYYKGLLADKQFKEMIEDIHTSSIRLIGIVNDFLDVSRLEQGKIKFSYAPVSVEKLVEGIAYEMRTVLNEKMLYLKVEELTLDSLPPVWADENRLKQVVYNIIGNSAKYTDKGGITISAKLSQDKDFVIVLVSDTGQGIAEASKQLLFHKFQQAGESLITRDTSRGTGLGLYISKKIIEIMGGKIELEYSEKGKGSTFSFCVPVATAERRMSSQQTAVQVDTITGITHTDKT